MSLPHLNRRSFLGTTAMTLAAAPFVSAQNPSASEPAAWKAGRKVGGFYLGPQAWTFRQFSVMEAIEFAGRTGSTIIEFFPGQTFSREKPDQKFDHQSNEEQSKAVADQLSKWNITPMNYGVT